MCFPFLTKSVFYEPPPFKGMPDYKWAPSSLPLVQWAERHGVGYDTLKQFVETGKMHPTLIERGRVYQTSRAGRKRDWYVLRDVLPLLWDKRSPRILDIGAGDGSKTALYASFFRFSTVVGHVMNLQSVKRVADPSEVADRLQFRHFPLCFASGGYDLVILNMVLHHATDWRKLVREASDLVAPGGYLFIRDHQVQAPSVEAPMLDIMHHLQDLIYRNYSCDGPTHYLSASDIDRQISRRDFALLCPIHISNPQVTPVLKAVYVKRSLASVDWDAPHRSTIGGMIVQIFEQGEITLQEIAARLKVSILMAKALIQQTPLQISQYRDPHPDLKTNIYVTLPVMIWNYFPWWAQDIRSQFPASQSGRPTTTGSKDEMIEYRALQMARQWDRWTVHQMSYALGVPEKSVRTALDTAVAHGTLYTIIDPEGEVTWGWKKDAIYR